MHAFLDLPADEATPVLRRLARDSDDAVKHAAETALAKVEA